MLTDTMGALDLLTLLYTRCNQFTPYNQVKIGFGVVYFKKCSAAKEIRFEKLAT
jgi:hypothetical protein